MGEETSLFVRRAVFGDSDAVRWVVERFHPMLAKLAGLRLAQSPMLASAVTVEDLTQDTWLLVLGKMTSETFDADVGRVAPRFCRYLGRTLNHRATAIQRTLIRSRADRASGGGAVGDDSCARPVEAEADVPTPQAEAVRSELARQIMERVESLDPIDSRMLVSRLFDGTPFKDLGHAEGMTGDAAKRRCQRALARIREFFPVTMVEEIAAEWGG